MRAAVVTTARRRGVSPPKSFCFLSRLAPWIVHVLYYIKIVSYLFIVNVYFSILSCAPHERRGRRALSVRRFMLLYFTEASAAGETKVFFSKAVAYKEWSK